MVASEPTASIMQIIGAAGFGTIAGWYIYYINRYRKGEVQFSDLATIIGIIGGAAILGLFPAKTDLFGAYGIGLFVGFFGYFAVLNVLVYKSRNFDFDWFLDGRRKVVPPGYIIPSDVRPGITQMEPPALPHADIAVAAAAGVTAALSRTGIVAQSPSADAVAVAPKSAQAIIDACEAVWNANKDDCNAFAKAVAIRFGITLNGQADDIVDQIRGPDWTPVSNGVLARSLAEAGMLVVAGLKAAEHNPPRTHGHVAIVVAGPLAHDCYPTGYWGSLGGIPAKRKTLNWAWRQEDRDHIHYAARAV